MSRMQLAQRIHLLLLREIGHAIEIERLLADARYARDVLLVCDAVPGGELAPLASLFRHATLPTASPAAAPGHAQQPTEWSRDTSGFGVTQPPPIASASPVEGGRRASDADAHDDSAERRRGWLPRWRDKPPT